MRWERERGKKRREENCLFLSLSFRRKGKEESIETNLSWLSFSLLSLLPSKPDEIDRRRRRQMESICTSQRLLFSSYFFVMLTIYFSFKTRMLEKKMTERFTQVSKACRKMMKTYSHLIRRKQNASSEIISRLSFWHSSIFLVHHYQHERQTVSLKSQSVMFFFLLFVILTTSARIRPPRISFLLTDLIPA